MPCQSYESNWANDSSDRDIKRLKAEADKLARIACAAMSELEKMGKEDFLILKNEEVGHWWAAHKEADRKERERVAEAERKKRVKEEALKRLTDEEKELLGLAPKVKKTHKKFPVSKELDVYVYREDIESLQQELDEYQKYSEDDVEHLYKLLRKNQI